MERAGAVVVEGEVGRRVPGGAHRRLPVPRVACRHGRRSDRATSAATCATTPGPCPGPARTCSTVPSRPGDLALHEPGAAAGQVAVVPAADGALDPGVHGLGDPARRRPAGSGGPGGRRAGRPGPSPRRSPPPRRPRRRRARRSSTSPGSPGASPAGATPSPSGTHRPQEVTTRCPPSAVGAVASTRSSGSSRPAKPSGSPSPPQAGGRSAYAGTGARPHRPHRLLAQGDPVLLQRHEVAEQLEVGVGVVHRVRALQPRLDLGDLLVHQRQPHAGDDARHVAHLVGVLAAAARAARRPAR